MTLAIQLLPSQPIGYSNYKCCQRRTKVYTISLLFSSVNSKRHICAVHSVSQFTNRVQHNYSEVGLMNRILKQKVFISSHETGKTSAKYTFSEQAYILNKAASTVAKFNMRCRLLFPSSQISSIKICAFKNIMLEVFPSWI